MNKPRLCLALSVSLALLQANVLPALSESPAIWQKLSGASSKPVAHAKTPAKTHQIAGAQVKRPVVANKVSNDMGLYTAYGLAAGTDSQVMLFFGKGKDSATEIPAAALTIHPSLPAVAEEVVTSASNVVEKPTLVAMGESTEPQITTDAGSTVSVTPVSSEAPATEIHPVVETKTDTTQIASNNADKGKLQIAQLAPDQIIAQGDNGGTTATPIPPVVSGAVELEEFKPSNLIELKVNQSRTFKLRNKIVRTSISEPSIAEPVVVAENQLVMLGKAPGGATMVVWDDAGNSAAIDIKVSRDYSALQSTIREIDPRIIVKPFNVGGSDRVLLVGDVDHAEAVLRAFSAANVFMDDRGMNIVAANSRLIGARIGEQAQTGGGGAGGGGGGGGGGGAGGQLSQISTVDKYTFFSNLNNNVGKAQVMVSDGGRVTSLARVRKTPLIVLHVTFMEMNTTAVRELGLQLGLNFSNSSFAFGLGGQGPGRDSLSTSPGLNGTNPFGYGFTTAAQQAPLIGTFTAPNAILNPLGLGLPINQITAAGLPVFPTTPLPSNDGTWFSQILGFMQQLPQKLINNGGITAPVRFLTGSVINPDGTINATAQSSSNPVGQGILNTAPNALLAGSAIFGGAPGAGTFTPYNALDGNRSNLANLFTAISNFTSGRASRWSLNPTVQGIITQRRARVLAEPTLVTISGERAAFLAGGEIPILQSIATAGTAQQSTTFEPFGLRLNMIPVLLENGMINLQVSPEERLRNDADGLVINGAFVPAFITRKSQTIVEMKPGQELYISGLVSANSSREINKTPILGEVPVLGALYRSKAFNKNESELVVAVRPEIIIPGTPGQMKMPEEISRVEAPRDTNIFQVEPTVVDERYMTSGRAERPQKVPGIQPSSAPVPDNF